MECVCECLQYFADVKQPQGAERRLVIQNKEEVIQQESILSHGTFLELDVTVTSGKDRRSTFTVISEEELAAANAADDLRLSK